MATAADAIILTNNQIEVQYEVIKKLRQKCDECKLLRDKDLEQIWAYSMPAFLTEAGDAMVAMAHYSDNTYAIYAPEYLEEQCKIFEYVMKVMYPIKQLIVFQKKVYDALPLHNFKDINVKLYS